MPDRDDVPSSADVSAEAFVRAGLGTLEMRFREMALLALADWANCEIVSPDLFNAVASLQRPSWGMWNGLLTALRNARKNSLRSGDAGTRSRIESAAVFQRVLGLLDEPIDPALAAALAPLGRMTRTSVSGKTKLGVALAMPITLRNRVAHDAPTDTDWWDDAAEALRPLVQFVATAGVLSFTSVEHSSPWFLEVDGGVLAFNGMERDFAILYANEAGVSRAVPERTHDVLLAFGKLLGKADEREKDFRRLLSKLAPQEIRGVMMGDWLVGPPVGEGGFAVVHVGRQLSTGRKVAIKILRDGMEPETVQRFQQEASFLSRFRHPNIVGVYGFGQETWAAPRAFSLSDEPWFQSFSQTAPVKTFIALEWIEGRTLDQVFQSGVADAKQRPDMRTLAGWMADSASALSAVHAAGLIHRDVKPHNLMVTGEAGLPPAGTADQTAYFRAGGQIKLMDFGIARSTTAARTLVTESGRSLGTPAYMSPEQIRAGEADAEIGPASDVYSLCATFYELFSGERLFHHDRLTVEQVRTIKSRGQRVTRPKIVTGKLPWEIETILLGGLEPEPADRYHTMDAVERDVRHFLADEPIEYRQPSLARRATLAYRRHRVVVNLVAAFVMISIVGTVFYIRRLQFEQEQTRQQRDVALKQEKIADEQRAIAVKRERESRLLLADLKAQNGHKLFETGDPAGALLWYLQSLPLLHDAPDRDTVHRLRIGLTLRQLSRPVANWEYPQKPGQVVLTAIVTNDRKTVIASEVIGAKPRGKPPETKGHLRAFDALSGSQVWTSELHDDPVWTIVASEDGKHAASVTLSEVGRLYTDQGRLVGVIERAGGVKSAIMSANGSRVAFVWGKNKDKVDVLDASTGQAVGPTIELPQPSVCAGFSRTAYRLYIGYGPDQQQSSQLRIYDATTLQPAADPLEVPTLLRAEFSREGSLIAVSSGEGWARVYQADDLKPVTRQLMHTAPVLKMAFSPESKRLATASHDKTARVWDLATSKLVGLAMEHPEPPYHITWSEDGTRVATLAYDKAARLWDAGSGLPLGSPLRATAEILDGSFTVDHANRFLLLTQSGSTHWDFTRSAEPGSVRIATGDDFSEAAFSPDSLFLGCNSASGKVRILSVTTGLDAIPPLQHPMAVEKIAFAHRGRRLITTCADGVARVWNPSLPLPSAATTRREPQSAPSAPERQVMHDGALKYAGVSADGTRLFTAGETNVALWDGTTGKPVATLSHPGNLSDTRFSPDDRWIATACADGAARIWNAQTGALTRTLKGSAAETRPLYISRFTDADTLLTAGESGMLRRWDVVTGQLKSESTGPAPAVRLDWVGDGTRFLAAGYRSSVPVFDATSAANPVAVIEGGGIPVVAALHRSGLAVFSASQSGQRFFELSGAPLAPPIRKDILADAQFSPDGKWLLTLNATNAYLWDVSPERRPIDDLTQIASYLSGRTIEPTGVMRTLKAEEQAALRTRLLTTYPGEILPEGGRRAD